MDIKTLLEFNAMLPRHKPRLLRGATGIGKSAMGKLIADSMKLELVVVNLAVFEPADMVGLPLIKDGKTTYAAPYWWPGPNSLLVLEELAWCSKDIQPLAMSLALDRHIANHRLPEDCIIFATANGKEYFPEDINQALMRRFALIDYTPTTDEWLQWIETQKDLKSLVVDFIKKNPNKLDTPQELVGKPNIAIPCRSSWTELSEALARSKYSLTRPMLEQFSAMYVGIPAARDFSFWAFDKNAITVIDVFAGQPNTVATKAMALIGPVCKDILDRPLKDQCNAIKFFLAGGPEIFAAFLAQVPKILMPLLNKVPGASEMADDIAVRAII